MICVVVDDLAFVGADAVVRPATATLDPVSSQLRNLESTSGLSFSAQIRPGEELAVGSAIVTDAGRLEASFVIHAIISSRFEPVSDKGVRRAIASVLHRAEAWQLARIALPPIGTGPGNLSLEKAAKIMTDVIAAHHPVDPYPEDVMIVVESEEERKVFEAVSVGGPR